MIVNDVDDNYEVCESGEIEKCRYCYEVLIEKLLVNMGFRNYRSLVEVLDLFKVEVSLNYLFYFCFRI